MTSTIQQPEIHEEATDFLPSPGLNSQPSNELAPSPPPELSVDEEVNDANWRDCLDEEANLEAFEATTTLDTEGREGDVPDDAYEVKTKRSFSSSPIVALALVLGSTTIALVVVGGIFWALSGAGELFADSGNTEAVDKGPKSPYAQLPENEQITQLKQRLSKKERDANVRTFNDQANQPPSPKPTLVATPTASLPTVSRIRSSSQPRPIASFRPPVARRLPAAPVARASRPVPAVSQPSAPKRTEDPVAAWERLAGLGAYQGNPDFANAASSAASYPPAQTAVYSPAAPPSGALASNRIAPPDEADTYISGTSVQIGTTAMAKLLMPIIWNDEISLGRDTILAELSQPLGDLPKGAILSLKVEKQSSSLLRLRVDGATVDGVERSVPDGVVANDGGGGPIVAKEKGTGRGITFGDVVGVALAGVSNAAGLINQPRQRTTLAADGVSQIVEDSSSRNLLAAVGQGATSKILETAQQRVGEVQSSRQPYFKVSAGKSLQILVTKNLYL
jgi:hypothetical protein